MNAELATESSKGRRGNWRRVILEAGVVAIAGSLLALIANAISPRGLSLTRDYFPVLAPNPARAQTATNSPVIGSTPAVQSAPQPALTNSPPATNAVLARLRSHGLQPIEHDEVVTIFKDPRAAQDRFVFVDARNDRQYQDGHIPGAVQVDFYQLDPYLPTALAACLPAEKVVVYCNGGDCDDSEKVADLLGKAVPKEKVFVYPGGITQWSAAGQPVEIGGRRSGVLKGARQ